MKIYLREFIDTKPKSIEEIFEKLFSIIINSTIRGKVTFKDPECAILQCDPGRRRSFEDLFFIVNTYFENTEPTVIFQKLLDYKLEIEGVRYYLWLTYCPDIQKPTVIFWAHNPNNTAEYWNRSGITQFTYKQLFLDTLGTNDLTEIKSRCPEVGIV